MQLTQRKWSYHRVVDDAADCVAEVMRLLLWRVCLQW